MARTSSNVTVRDLGWRQFKTNARALRGAGVKVGIRAGQGSEDGVDVVDIAIWNEFGAKRKVTNWLGMEQDVQHIPPRPFMRHTADTSERAVRSYAGRLAGQVMDGRLGVDQVLNVLGEWYKQRIQATIRKAKAWAEPNAPNTVKAKGSDRPLINQGVLINTIDYQIDR